MNFVSNSDLDPIPLQLRTDPGSEFHCVVAIAMKTNGIGRNRDIDAPAGPHLTFSHHHQHLPYHRLRMVDQCIGRRTGSQAAIRLIGPVGKYLADKNEPKGLCLSLHFAAAEPI